MTESIQITEENDNTVSRTANGQARHEMTKEEFEKLGILEQIRAVHTKAYIDRDRVMHSFILSIINFWYGTLTFIYIHVCYHIPELKDSVQWANVPGWPGYYLYILSWFCFLNSAINWLFTIAYSRKNFYTSKSEDRPNLRKQLWEDYDSAVEKSKPRRVLMEADADSSQKSKGASNTMMYYPDWGSGQQWKRCIVCEDDVPPRAHHCVVCQRCVLKRDHHCYMTGVCIGFYNQRYFVMLAFYCSFTCIIGVYNNWHYLCKYYWNSELMNDYWDLFLPVTLFRGFIWRSLPFHIAVMLSQMYLYPLVGLMASAYFGTQIYIILFDKTFTELQKSIKINSRNSIYQRFCAVFGPVWILNFIFPTQLFFRQSDDGTNWRGIIFVQNLSILKKARDYLGNNGFHGDSKFDA